MITREQWDSMTDQQQWDYVCLLENQVHGDDEETETLPPVEERRITYAQRIELRSKGYKATQQERGWYCVTPNGYSVLRGWAKTEDLAWWHCWRHDQRQAKH